MPQNSLLIQDGTGAKVLVRVNGALEALQTQNSGPAEPESYKAHQVWADTSTSLLKRRAADNSAWVPVHSLENTHARVGSDASPIVASDFGLSIYCTGTYAQAVPSTASVFVGWYVDVANIDTGDVTLTPPAATTINGAATAVLKKGESAKLKCVADNKYILQRYASDSAPVGVPVGTIIAHAAPTLPDGFLPAVGGSASITAYQALFDVIGYTYSDQWNTPPSGKFFLPNLASRTIVGGVMGSTILPIGYTPIAVESEPYTYTKITRSLPPTTSQANVYTLNANMTWQYGRLPLHTKLNMGIKY